MDVLIGLVYFKVPLPTLASLPVGDSADFLQFGVRVSDAIYNSNDDLYFVNNAYDALSLVINAERGRKDPNDFDPLGGVAASAWSKAFTKMCGRTPCSVLTFEIFEDSKIPVLNKFLYTVLKK
jgi:hypothetical protein